MHIPALQLVSDLRPAAPVSVYRARVPDNRDDQLVTHRFAVIWDEDNDERVLDVAAALYFREPTGFRNVLALHENKGELTAWVTGDTESIYAVLSSIVNDDDVILRRDSWLFSVRELFLDGLAAVWLSTAGDGSLTDELDDFIAILSRVLDLGYWRSRTPWGES